MFEFEQKYKRGKKTFFFLYLKHGWTFNLAGFLLLLLAWAVYYGPLYPATAGFLSNHENWYITPAMLSQWLVLIASASLIMALLEAHVIYAHYKFLLDDHAFNLYKGVFFIRETIIPYQQISNVNITRPYHYRIFGISQLDILTAGDKGASQHEEGGKKSHALLIPIIDAHIARDLARQLMECASKKRKGEDVRDTLIEITEDATDEDERDDTDSEENEKKSAITQETHVPGKHDVNIVDDDGNQAITEKDDDNADSDDDDETVAAKPKPAPKEAGDDITVESKKNSEDDLYPTIDLKNL